MDSADYKRGEDPVLDSVLDDWHLPPEAAAQARGTFAYAQRKLAAQVGGLKTDTLVVIRRRLHRAQN